MPETESQIRSFSDDELLLEVTATEELIYRIECFGVRDLIYLAFLYREVERRDLQDRLNVICAQSGSLEE